MSFAKKKVYLAGPITGQSYNGARHGWRKAFSNILTERAAHIECYSPMREKEFLEREQCIGGDADYQSLHGFGTPQGILTRDHNDVFTCDAMIACFLGADRVSVGTCVEFGFAHAHRKPVIMIMEEKKLVKVDSKIESLELSVNLDRHEVYAAMEKKFGTAEILDSKENFSTAAVTYRLKVPGKETWTQNPHDHVFLRACAGYVVPTLEHAADICQSLLTPGL